jgi:hypothetical protein
VGSPGSKARQFLQFAREPCPGYRVAKLSELMTSSGSVARSCRFPRTPAWTGIRAENPDQPQTQVHRKKNQQIMLQAALATMKR